MCLQPRNNQMRLYENVKGEPWSALRQVQHLEVSRRPEFCVCVLVTQSCPTLCDPMDCGLPVSSVHGILRARTLEWVAISYSWGSSPHRNQTQVSFITGRFFTVRASREALPPGSHQGRPEFSHILNALEVPCLLSWCHLLRDSEELNYIEKEMV